MTDCFARAALGHSTAPPSIVMKSRRFNPSPRPRAVPVCPAADPSELTVYSLSAEDEL